MKPVRVTVLFVALTALANACQSPPPSREEKIAKAYCECMSRIVEMNHNLSEKAVKDSIGQTMQLFEELEKAYLEAKECTGTVIGQFGRLKQEEMPAVEQILSKQCPELAAQRDLLQEMLGE